MRLSGEARLKIKVVPTCRLCLIFSNYLMKKLYSA
jgi:hypothetical protein